MKKQKDVTACNRRKFHVVTLFGLASMLSCREEGKSDRGTSKRSCITRYRLPHDLLIWPSVLLPSKKFACPDITFAKDQLCDIAQDCSQLLNREGTRFELNESGRKDRAEKIRDVQGVMSSIIGQLSSASLRECEFASMKEISSMKFSPLPPNQWVKPRANRREATGAS